MYVYAVTIGWPRMSEKAMDAVGSYNYDIDPGTLCRGPQGREWVNWLSCLGRAPTFREFKAKCDEIDCPYGYMNDPRKYFLYDDASGVFRIVNWLDCRIQRHPSNPSTWKLTGPYYDR